MNDETRKNLEKDPDGLLTYEYIANHIESCMDEIEFLTENMRRVDQTGQFLVSTARYLNAIDRVAYTGVIQQLIADAIDRDREHRYIAALLPDIWGEDFASRAEELSASDNNFRRIYKRINHSGF